MRRELIACVWMVVVCCRSLYAQPCPRLEVRNPEGNYIVPGSLGDIQYAPGLALDAYVQQSRRSTPAVVVIHGGRWTSGSRVAHVGQILELLTRAGYHWFSLDYRAAGLARYKDSLTDIRAALTFIRCHAGDLGIDPAKLVLLGEDSGAHLAALLAAERPPGVIGTVLLGGFYDLAVSEAAKAVGTLAAAPASRIVRGMPPTVLIHGGGDGEVPLDEAQRYCAKLREATNRCEFVEEPGASHRVENWWPSQWNYKNSLVRWLGRLQPGAARQATFRYGAVHKDIVYDPDARLKLDAYAPRSTSPKAAVLIVHGGGWEAGDKVTYVTPLFEPLARSGVAWFSIDYRLTPAFRNEDQIQDVRKAVAFLRREHARFNIDPKRIILLGESASGQIVLQVGADDPDLGGIVSFYGVYDFNAMVTDAGPRSLLTRLFHRNVLDDEARALMRRYSPLHTARREMPPVLLINGTGERLWDQALAFQGRLKQIGARHESIALENAPHGLENWEGHPEWMFYKERLIAWIRDVTP